MTQAYNFSAGPAMLPKEVLLKIQEELIEYENSKASVMEISHRGIDFMEAAQKSEKDFFRAGHQLSFRWYQSIY